MLKILPLVMLWLIPFSVQAQAQPLTLQQCINRALTENLDLQAARNNNRFNTISLQQARANQLPSLNASGSQQFSFGRSIDPFTNQYIEQNIASNNFSINSNILLFQGFQNRNLIRQYESAQQAGVFDVQRFERDITIAVVAAYLQVIYTLDQVQIAFDQYNLTLQTTERTQRLIDAGSIPEIQLLQINAQASAEHAAYVQAQNNLQLSRVNLMQLIELPLTDVFEIEVPELNLPDEAPPVPSVFDIYEEALATQPQIAASALWWESAEYATRVAKGMKYPRLTLGGNIFTGYSDARSLVSYHTSTEERPIGYLMNDPSELVVSRLPVTTVQTETYPFSRQIIDNLSQAAILSLTIPIYNNRMANANLERSMINLEQAGINDQQVRNNLRKAIEQAFADYSAAVARHNAAVAQREAYRQSFAAAEQRYNLGLMNAIDYTTEKNILTRSEIEASQALFQLVFNRNILNFYRGLPFDL